MRFGGTQRGDLPTDLRPTGSVVPERTFRACEAAGDPVLAICIYHRLEDFFDILNYLASLQLGYCLFLRHFTIHIDETVLFATVN